MRQFLIVLLNILLFSFNQHHLKAADLDSLLIGEYQAGRSRILSVIEKECLSDSILDHSFYAYTLGNSWIITTFKNNHFIVYYNNGRQERFVERHFPEDTKELACLFSLIDLKIEDNDRQYDTKYHPAYFYLFLYDSQLNSYFEWNSSTYNRKYQKKIQKLIKKSISYLYDKTGGFI